MITVHAKNIPRTLSQLLLLAIVCLTTLFLNACTNEDTLPNEGIDDIELEDGQENSTLTIQYAKRTSSPSSAEAIHSIYVILSEKTKEKGNISYKQSVTPTNGKITMKVRPSSYDVYVWANVPEAIFTKVNTLTDLSTVMTGPLSAYTSLPLRGNGTATLPPGTTKRIDVTLSQFTAKIAVNIEKEYDDMQIVSAKLCNSTKEIPLTGTLSTDTKTITKTTASTDTIDLTKPFYVWNNTLIGRGSATDWSQRNVTDAPTSASYIELKVKLFDGDIPNINTYRVYLGGLTNDATKIDYADYNIYPGIAYTYNITLKRNSIAVWGHVPDPGYAEAKANLF